MRVHRLSGMWHFRLQDRACIGFRDEQGFVLGPAKGHIGHLRTPAGVYSIERNACRSEDPNYTQTHMSDVEISFVVQTHTVRSTRATGQVLEDTYLVIGPAVGRQRNMPNLAGPGHADKEHLFVVA